MTDKILIDRSVLNQALDALEEVSHTRGPRCKEFLAIEALRDALAASATLTPTQLADRIEAGEQWAVQPAEPVAMIVRTQHESGVLLQWASVEAAHNTKPGPLYAAPAQQPQPAQRQPLTRKECLNLEVWPMMTIEQVVRVVEKAHGIGEAK